MRDGYEAWLAAALLETEQRAGAALGLVLAALVAEARVEAVIDAAPADGPGVGEATVPTACPHCDAPIAWQRRVRHDGKRALAIAAWPCRCPLTAAEWAALAASAALVAGDTSPAWLAGHHELAG